MFKKLFGILGLGLLMATPTLAQTTAGPSVIGYWANAPQTNCPIGPCFIQYGATLPVTASIAGFAPNGSVSNLSVSNVTGNVALPSGASVVVTNTGANTAHVKLSVGAGSAATTDLAVVAGAAVGFTVGSNTFINAITDASTTTLSLAGGTGLVTGYGGGSGGGGAGGNVTIVGPFGSTVSASSIPVVIASDQAAVSVKQATAANFNATVVGSGTAGTAATGVITVQGIASMTKLLVTPDANSAVNVAQVNGVTTLAGTGAVGTGSIRVAVGTDTATVAGSTPAAAGLGATGSAVPSGAQYPGVNVGGTLRGLTAVNPSGTVYAAQTDLTSVNGITVLTGTGATGTGAQRVTIATDTATIAGSAPGTAGSPSTNVVSIQGVASGTVVPVSSGVAQGSSTSGQTVSPIGVASLSTTPTRTTTQTDMPAGTLNGAMVVMPYALSDSLVSGVITSAMTGTTSTSLVAAPAGSLHNYITQITCSNSHATVGTDIILQDGNGGTTIYVLPAAIAYGGAALNFLAPLRQPTAATALYVANVTTGASTKCAASGFKAL